MRIEVLYFDDCPLWQQALEHAKAAVGEGQPVDLLKIETLEQARAEHFAGSPTIRVDGHDLFPVGDGQYGLACRVYRTADGASGAPSVTMIRAALDRS
jgi:hypothetical protein